jgi:predicted O-methyltransferase YrrM
VPGIQVTSIEYNKQHRDVALENTKGLDNINIIHGAALDVLPKLAEEGNVYDFIFIDADWLEQHQYFDWAVKLSRKGGCIFVDNAVRQLTESRDDAGRALVDFVAKDGRVQSTLMLVVNTVKAEHGSPELSELADGFVMAIVK